MRNFILSAENTADLPKNFYAENNIEFCQLGGMIGEDEFGGVSGKSIGAKEFFNRMRNGEKTSTTQVNLDQAEKFFEKFLKEGKDVLHLSFSSVLSGTYNTLCSAAANLNKQYKNKILVLDTRAASLGQGLFVNFVNIKANNEGLSLQEAYDYALSIRDDICHYFVVDDLDYLYRGGRVSKTTAILGSLLRIKPVLHVDLEGKLIPIKKVMTRRKSLSTLVDFMQSKFSGVSDTVYIVHGDCEDEAEYVASLVTERLNIPHEKILINQLGAVIGSHSGPGTVALFFHGKNKKEN